jgi:hypothetical protein
MDGPEPSTSPVTLPWQEHGDREFKDIFATGVLALLLAVAVVGFYNALRGEPGSQLASGIAALVLAVLGYLVWYGPWGGIGARVSVDHDGLWVRHWGWRLWPGDTEFAMSFPKHLPADQIGEVKLVSEKSRSQMWRKSMALRYEGRSLGWTRNNVHRETREAVLIEQIGSDLRRPWWLLRCRQCSELVEALELARDRHRSEDEPAS